ncbi:MAG: hypothetical protein PUF50_01365 [Erysipelotrichaceae bacterium]|nr:hypothetical protein [Erysipelotrichaceae bacterium]
MNWLDILFLGIIIIALGLAIRYSLTHKGCGCSSNCQKCKKACIK